MNYVIVIDMDKPNNCGCCPFSKWDDGYNGGYKTRPQGYFCRRLKRLIEEKGTVPRDCPIVEVIIEQNATQGGADNA